MRFRSGVGGTVFHVLNRGARRGRLFESSQDYEAFLRVLREGQEHLPVPLLCLALMSNHWHLVLWPVGDNDLSLFMQWVTRTHAQRWHLARQTVGTGAVYQGRYRAIPVQSDSHFLTVCRYVERNPARAGLVARTEEWRWSTAWPDFDADRPRLSPWPISRPSNWLEWCNEGDSEEDLEHLRRAIRRQVPFGDDDWCATTAERLHLTPACRGRGRPRREEPPAR